VIIDFEGDRAKDTHACKMHPTMPCVFVAWNSWYEITPLNESFCIVHAVIRKSGIIADLVIPDQTGYPLIFTIFVL